MRELVETYKRMIEDDLYESVNPIILEAADKIKIIQEIDELSIFGKHPGKFKMYFDVNSYKSYIRLSAIDYNKYSVDSAIQIEDPQNLVGFIANKLFINIVGNRKWSYPKPKEVRNYFNFMSQFFSVNNFNDFATIEGDLATIDKRDLDKIENFRVS